MTRARLNCYIDAWMKLASGEAKWMCCRKSAWNKLDRFIAPIRWVGTALVWFASGLWLVGFFFKFGTWPHWVYCNGISDDCMEYVPRTPKTAHFLPPLLFEGDRRHAATDRRQRQRRESDRRE